MGAREHYAIPRALERRGRLRQLVADAWVRPDSAWRMMPGAMSRRLRERYHSELSAAVVRDYTASLIAREVQWRLSGRTGWDLFSTRNRWFQETAAGAVDQLAEPQSEPTVLFAHSYAALEIFRRAKPRGWTLVLGQIDPGPEHVEIVTRSALAAPEYGPPPSPPPAGYFDDWREECRLADRIVVNSDWSRSCLERAGVPASKLTVIPLAYEPNDSGDRTAPERRYPDRFTPDRPLKLLFVGHVGVAKGAKALLDSLALLRGVPFELSMVGEVAMQVPRAYVEHPSVRWVGPVSRRDVMRRYRDADLLIFPSLSDGFGMVQIEAQGWRLPIVASRSCGRVVEDGVNGLLLEEVSPEALASAITRVASDPRLLAAFAGAAAARPEAGVSALGDALVRLEPT